MIFGQKICDKRRTIGWRIIVQKAPTAIFTVLRPHTANFRSKCNELNLLTCSIPLPCVAKKILAHFFINSRTISMLLGLITKLFWPGCSSSLMSSRPSMNRLNHLWTLARDKKLSIYTCFINSNVSAKVLPSFKQNLIFALFVRSSFFDWCYKHTVTYKAITRLLIIRWSWNFDRTSEKDVPF